MQNCAHGRQTYRYSDSSARLKPCPDTNLIENQTQGATMAKLYHDADADITLIQGKRVAILGYGSQGHAHAQNLKDSGVDVRVGLHAGSKSRAKAERHGLRVMDVADAVADADVVMVLTPDVGQARLYRESIEPHLRPGMMLMFAHGFSIHFGQIEPPAGVDVTMIAPKAPGH